MNATPNHRLWEQILRSDEVNQAYFGERSELPNVSLFCAERADARSGAAHDAHRGARHAGARRPPNLVCWPPRIA